MVYIVTLHHFILMNVFSIQCRKYTVPLGVSFLLSPTRPAPVEALWFAAFT
jgi:hypothetical protein